MASVVSIIPIVLLFVLMLGFKMAGHKSALLTLVVTVLLALFAASPLGMIAPEHRTQVHRQDHLHSQWRGSSQRGEWLSRDFHLQKWSNTLKK